MKDYFTLSAISKERHLELVAEKSDRYDKAEKYGITCSQKILEGDGTPDSPYKIEVSIKNTSADYFEGIIKLELTGEIEDVSADGTPVKTGFYLPGFMYGTNRGDKPWKVDCKFPRLRSSVIHPENSDCPLSSFYMVRADRLSHPCALMYMENQGGQKEQNASGRILGFNTTPLINNEKGFVQYGGFTCHNDSEHPCVGYTFGYENAPWLFIQSHTIMPRQTEENYFALKPKQEVSQTFYVYDFGATAITDIHKVIRNVYDIYHEPPRPGKPVEEAVKDLSLAVCDYAWLPELKCYSGFVREDGFDEAGKEKFSYNTIPSISWTNGIVVAYPQLVAAAKLENKKMREQALACIQNVVDGSLNPESSLPYETFDGKNWSCHGWWYDGMHSGGHSAYLDGQFIYYLLKSYLFEKENNKTTHSDWLDFAKKVISSFERERNRSGEYPFIFSEADGCGIEYDSLGSCWCLAASALYTKIAGTEVCVLERSLTHYYDSFIAKLECYGSPLDTDKAPDNEGILAFIRAAKILHQITGIKLYLDYLETALDQEFSYKFCYNSRITVPPLSNINWSSCGGSITSVCNPHIHPMSSSIVGEMEYFIKHAGADSRTAAYIKSRLEDTVRWGCQTYNHHDGEYGYGKVGWMSERFCYSQGLVVEKYPDGTPASTWFALMPWASASVLEGLLDYEEK